MAVSTKTLQIVRENKSISFKPKQNLLELLNANKISINQACGASGSCTTCRVTVIGEKKSFSERTEIETERAHERQYGDDERLACQTFLLDDAEIEIPQVVI